MPQTLVVNPATPRPDEDMTFLPRKRWTREECRRLTEMDMLPEGQWELIAGDMIWRMGQNEPHVFVRSRVLQALIGLYGFDHARLPAPVEIDEFNEPEPDVAVTTKPLRHFLIHGMPKPADLRLAVEVSDATLQGDLTFKMRLYARAGITEYWVVDIQGRTLFVFRNPTADGYATRISYGEDEVAAPLSAPDAAILVRDLLP